MVAVAAEFPAQSPPRPPRAIPAIPARTRELTERDQVSRFAQGGGGEESKVQEEREMELEEVGGLGGEGVEGGPRVSVLGQHGDVVNGVAGVEGVMGGIVASVSADCTAAVWRITDGATLATLTLPARGVCVALSHELSQAQTCKLVVGCCDAQVATWHITASSSSSTPSFTPLPTLNTTKEGPGGGGGELKSISVSVDGEYLVSGSTDKNIQVWAAAGVGGGVGWTHEMTLSGHSGNMCVYIKSFMCVCVCVCVCIHTHTHMYMHMYRVCGCPRNDTNGQSEEEDKFVI